MGWKEELLELKKSEATGTTGASISKHDQERILNGFLKESVFPALRQTKRSLADWGYDVELSPLSDDVLHVGEGGGVMLVVRAGLRPLEQAPVAFRVVPRSLEVLDVLFEKPFSETESRSVAFGFSVMDTFMPLLNEFLTENGISKPGK